MRVVVLHNAVPAGATADQEDVLVQVEVVASALAALNCDPIRLPVTLNLEAARRHLRRWKPDVVFNLVESLGHSDRLAPLAPMLLEALDLPYTGAPARALAALADKPTAKRQMQLAGIPTPPWYCSAAAEAAAQRAWPGPGRYIIKPRYEHASLGIGPEAVVELESPEAADRQVARRERQLHLACFAERFIAGREFNLSVLGTSAGPLVLPPAEIDFSAFEPQRLRIVDYRAKWEADSFEYRQTPRRFDFLPADAPLLARLAELAACCWRHFGLRGYARVDFRVDERNQPWVLEINANPCLSPEAGFAAAVAQSGRSFPEAVCMILDDANRPRSPLGRTAARGEATPNARCNPSAPHA